MNSDAPVRSVLGRAVSGSLDRDQIEVWNLPRNVTQVAVNGHEVQAICPVTGNPDIYDVSITHEGFLECESKALKMYLLRFRDQGISCARLASTIADDLTFVLQTPVTVALRQQTRGGLRLSAEARGSEDEA